MCIIINFQVCDPQPHMFITLLARMRIEIKVTIMEFHDNDYTHYKGTLLYLD